MTKRRPSSPISEQACSRRRVRSSSVGDLFACTAREAGQTNQLHLYQEQTGGSQSHSDQQPASALVAEAIFTTTTTTTTWGSNHSLAHQPSLTQQVQQEDYHQHHQPTRTHPNQHMQQYGEGREVEQTRGEGETAPPTPAPAPTPGRRGGSQERVGEGRPVVRLLVLGGHGVGKSALTVRYLTRRFIGEYKSQVDIIYRQTLLLDGIKINLEIVDISTRPGEESIVPRLEICQCDGYLVLYSVAERPTFLAACRLLHAILTLRPSIPRPPITLLGNKQDLEHCRQVTVEEGRVTSSVFGCIFAEVSVAETSDNIAPIFTSLIRRALATSCLCPRPAAALLHPGSCRDIFLVTGHSCRSSGEVPGCLKCPDFSPSNHSTKCTRQQEEAHACSRCQKEKLNRKIKCRNKQQAVRSFSSPPQISDSLNYDECERNKENQNPPPSFSVLQTPSEVEEEELFSSSGIIGDSEGETNKFGQQPGLCRSFSFPEEWNVFRSIREQSLDFINERNKDNDVKNVAIHMKDREARFLKLSRAGSLVVNSDRTDSSVECYCQTRRRTKSFKSSGKLEIVTIKKPEAKLRSSNLIGTRYGDIRSTSPGVHERSQSKTFKIKTLKLETNTQDDSQSPLLLHTASKTPRSSRKFLFDPLDVRSGEDGLASPTNNRQRKFSVFGRALGSFLSKGSLPDLPRATANICDKFGSLKKTIKKRSV